MRVFSICEDIFCCVYKNGDDMSMYKTKQQRQLLDFFLKNISSQFTINEIVSQICPDDGAGKSTIYRRISKMVEDGTLMKLRGEDGKSTVYQYSGEGTDCGEHFHLKCTSCGKLIHLNCSQLDDIRTHISDDHDFTVDVKKTVLYGICSDCKKDKE